MKRVFWMALLALALPMAAFTHIRWTSPTAAASRQAAARD